MTGRMDARLTELGIELPAPFAPVANYRPFVRSGDLVFVSGQVSILDGKLICGKLGADADVEQGKAAAHACGLLLIAQAKAACEGHLDRIRRVVKLTGFVNATPDFGEHPEVINGASDLMVAVFGDLGVHARAAVGCGSLPRGVMVEVEAVFEVD